MSSYPPYVRYQICRLEVQKMREGNIFSQPMVGCCYLLQATAPIKLIGTLGAGIEPNGVGWVKFVFSDIKEFIKFQLLDEAVLITLEVDIALKLSGLFLLLVAQNKEFRKLQQLDFTQRIELSTTQFAPLEVRGISSVDDTSLHLRRGVIELRLPRNMSAMQVNLEDEQIELQLREEVAQQVGLLIIEQLGILTAHLSLRMLQEASPD